MRDGKRERKKVKWHKIQRCLTKLINYNNIQGGNHSRNQI